MSDQVFEPVDAQFNFSEAEKERNKLLYQALELMDSIELEAGRMIAA